MLKPTAQVETAQQNLAMEEDSIKEIESQVSSANLTHQHGKVISDNFKTLKHLSNNFV